MLTSVRPSSSADVMMTPEMSENEGNSVDPPMLRHSSGPHCLIGSTQISHSLDSPRLEIHNPNFSGDSVDPPFGQHMLSVPNNVSDVTFPSSKGHLSSYGVSNLGGGIVVEQRVVESSRTETSRACYQSISTGDGKSTELSSVVKESRDARTCSVSVSGDPSGFLSSVKSYRTSHSSIPISNQVSSANVPLHVGGAGVNSPSFVGNRLTSSSLSVSVDHRVTVSRTSSQPEHTKPSEILSNKDPTSQSLPDVSVHKPSSFNFETSDLAFRLKPQLTSSFMSKEMCSTPDQGDVENILRKYGIETRKYKPPVALMSRYSGGGDDIRESVTNNSSSLQRGNNINNPVQNNLQSEQFATPKTVDVSQNNESLNLLEDPQSDNSSSTDPPPLQAPASVETSPMKPMLDKTIGDQITETYKKEIMHEEITRSNEIEAVDNTSKNNDTQGGANVVAAVEMQAHHGSSVDMTNRADKQFATADSYPALRGTTATTGYQSSYSSTRTRQGYSTASQPSNMDAGFFDGYYFKSRLTTPKYSSSTRITNMLSETPTPGGVKDYSSTRINGLLANSGNTRTDKLGFSLLQERQRLHHIDNLITSGPSRISRPYMSIHHTPNTSSPSPGLSRTESIGNQWTTSATEINPSDTFDVPSYDNPEDMATIRNAGSNVDTGQFNNNRGENNNTYNPEVVERIMAKLRVQEMHQKQKQEEETQNLKQNIQKEKKPVKKVSYNDTQGSNTTNNKTTQSRDIIGSKTSRPASKKQQSCLQKTTPSVRKTVSVRNNIKPRQTDSSLKATSSNGTLLTKSSKNVLHQSISDVYELGDKARHCSTSCLTGTGSFCSSSAKHSLCGENIRIQKTASASSINSCTRFEEKKRQLMYNKYQPYKACPQHRQLGPNAEQPFVKDCDGVGHMGHENPIKESASYCKCGCKPNHTKQPPKPHCVWKGDAKERERCLIAATAFASGLIQMRQLQQQKLLQFNGPLSGSKALKPEQINKPKLKPGKGTSVAARNKTTTTRPTSAKVTSVKITKSATPSRPKSARAVKLACQ